jgi:5'-nucleotidase (lipoprotein e(P4) family)
MSRDHFYFSTKSTGSSKESRRKAILRTHEIIVLLGDNLIDLNAAFDRIKTSEERKGKVDSLKNRWGDLYVIFPNSTYGDWEGVLYYKFRKMNDAKFSSLFHEQTMRIEALEGVKGQLKQ